MLIGRALRVTTVAAGVCLTTLPCAASKDEPKVGATAEDSILVATRQSPTKEKAAAEKKDASKDESLEPVSQYSEHTPDLAEQAAAEADVEKETGDKFSAALAGVNEPKKIDAQPAKFNGIQPGKSTEKDVRNVWQEPKRTTTTDDGAVLTYAIEPFRAVEVQIADDTVTAINIELQSSLPPKRLAKQLSLDKLEAVAVTDAEGTLLGQAYPERGVLFMFAPPSDVVVATTNAPPAAVTHVVVQPLDADAFALRAESRLHGPYEQNINDLNTALALNPNLAHAHWLLSEIYLSSGQADKAKASADAACEIDPDNAAYQLRKAEAEVLLGQYDDATLAIRAVLDDDNTPPIVKAQALHEMGKLASLGDIEIASKAIAFENRAIALADSLATSKNVKERRAAKQVLIESHLAVARQIAKQDFENKLASVSQWISRASGLAEDMISHDGGSLELRLMVARESLEALANFKPTKDPGPFVSEAEETAAT
ncbi:MAG: tetratricopeptide repeat protein, partial [Pirellulales bacterium]